MVLAWAEKNIELLFPKRKMTKEMIREAYCPLFHQKGEYDPVFKTKINSSAIIYKNEIDSTGGSYVKASVEDITPSSEVLPVVTFDRIWVMSGTRFGLTALTVAGCLWPKKEKDFSDIFPFFAQEVMCKAG